MVPLDRKPVYGINFRHVYPVNPPGYKIGEEQSELQFVQWNRAGSGLVIIYNYNVYYKKSATDETLQVTNTGEHNNVFNGVADWNYDGKNSGDVKK